LWWVALRLPTLQGDANCVTPMVSMARETARNPTKTEMP
jgi:hypothetical protein